MESSSSADFSCRTSPMHSCVIRVGEDVLTELKINVSYIKHIVRAQEAGILRGCILSRGQLGQGHGAWGMLVSFGVLGDYWGGGDLGAGEGLVGFPSPLSLRRELAPSHCRPDGAEALGLAWPSVDIILIFLLKHNCFQSPGVPEETSLPARWLSRLLSLPGDKTAGPAPCCINTANVISWLQMRLGPKALLSGGGSRQCGQE